MSHPRRSASLLSGFILICSVFLSVASLLFSLLQIDLYLSRKTNRHLSTIAPPPNFPFFTAPRPMMLASYFYSSMQNLLSRPTNGPGEDHQFYRLGRPAGALFQTCLAHQPGQSRAVLLLALSQPHEYHPTFRVR